MRYQFINSRLLLVLATFGFCNGSTSSAAKKNAGIEAPSVAFGANSIPIHPHGCVIETEIEFPAAIESLEKSEIRSIWPSLIEKIEVRTGEAVHKGQIMATVDTSDANRQVALYEDFQSLIKSQLEILANDMRLLTLRRQRVEGLVKKGINPSTDLEQIDRQILEVKSSALQNERSADIAQKALKLQNDMAKKANFYSDMDGVVTSLIAEPESLTGKLMAMNSTLIARIEKPGHYVAKANLLDVQVTGLHEGLEATVVFPDQSRYQGRVAFIAPVAIAVHDDDDSRRQNYLDPNASNNSASGPAQYQLQIDFQRAGPMLPAGLTAITKVVLSKTNAKICLPWNAIDVANGTASIKTFQEGTGWQTKQLVLGKRGATNVEILSPDLKESTIVDSKLW